MEYLDNQKLFQVILIMKVVGKDYKIKKLKLQNNLINQIRLLHYSMKYQKRHQLLEIISEYKSDKSALTKQIDDLKRQLNEAESRIKRLLIRCEQFVEENNKTEE